MECVMLIVVALVWFAVSVPATLIVGRMLAAANR
jgi:hypothetical protein